MRSLNSRALVATAAVCTVALVGCAWVVLTPPAVPTSIASSATALSAPVASETFLDSTQLNMRLAVSPAQKLTAPVSGLITSNRFTNGQPISSGTAPLAINGSALIALATPAPLWRDLVLGDSGTDVSGLQLELARLGYKTNQKGTVDAATLAAVLRLAKASIASSATPSDPTNWGTGSIQRAQFLWLPAATVTPSECPLQLGQPISDGDTIATLAQTLTSVTILTIPTTATGPHVLLVDDKPIAVPESGVITDPASLASINASAAYAKYLADAPAASDKNNAATTAALSFSYQLATPLKVIAVPAAALYSLSGTMGCLQSGSTTLAAAIVGSQLGKTFITLDGDTTITRVSLKPDTTKLCR